MLGRKYIDSKERLNAIRFSRIVFMSDVISSKIIGYTSIDTREWREISNDKFYIPCFLSILTVGSSSFVASLLQDEWFWAANNNTVYDVCSVPFDSIDSVFRDACITNGVRLQYDCPQISIGDRDCVISQVLNLIN